MARNKLDGVIEAVRYSQDGHICMVRAYERYGAVWSDRLLMERKSLSERLEKGKRFAVGERQPFYGGVFVTGKGVILADKNIITAGQAGAHDFLDGVPIF